ncbi:hypothetical protein, partial [Methanobrevibacter sp.]|uniref:hypothetical protein n=1 Tax=Methanobrevibacter sp. TaxID=66852 RepID=UPI00388F6055
ENEKTTEVEQTEKAADVVETPAVEENKKAEKPEDKKAEEKPIKDDDKIVIICAAYAGKSIVLPTRTIQLDEKGCCEVTGVEAKRLLTIPGYERK